MITRYQRHLPLNSSGIAQRRSCASLETQGFQQQTLNSRLDIQ